jgi:hypothetical protein
MDDYLAKLPKKDRRSIDQKAEELIAKEATLRQLQEALIRSPEEAGSRECDHEGGQTHEA